MTWTLLLILAVVYVGGVYSFKTRGWRLRHYVWSAFGLAFLLVHAGLLLDLQVHLASAEARHVSAIMGGTGLRIEVIDDIVLMVPDPTGWSGLMIGAESSSIIEMSAFAGLILFYPNLSRRRRLTSLTVGILLTYALNIGRLIIIVLMIHTSGKSSYALAHAVVGRLAYFAGIVALYWYLFTRPTLSLVQLKIATSERASY